MDDFLIALMCEYNEEQLQRLTERQRLLHLRDRSDPFTLEEPIFIKLFRLPPHGALSLIEALSANADFLHGSIPPHIKVLCALHFYGQGSYQTPVGYNAFISISQATVSRCIDIVSKHINTYLVPKCIVFPNTDQGKQELKEGFHSLGFPNTLGAIDGTHIAIVAPKTTDLAPKILFFNRKGFYSINVQVVCDSKGKIMNVNPNFPGSTHDAAVWGASNINHMLKAQYIAGSNNQWLIGDKGYPLVPWLMTPHAEVQRGSPAASYNLAHAKARNVIELCFGRLKGRFRCLLRHRILHYNPEKAATILLACCALHNMFIDHWTDYFDSVNELPEISNRTDVDAETDFYNQGREIRDQITESFFRN